MKRVLTALVGAPLVLWATLRLPASAFFWLLAIVFCLAAREYSRLQSRWAPDARLWLVVPLVPITALILAPAARPAPLRDLPLGAAPLLALLAGATVAAWALWIRTPPDQGGPAIGAVSFGALYLGLPLAAMVEVQAQAPWLLVLLLAVVWLGDTAAYYVGCRFGRRKLAPQVSPNKTWEGAVAAFVAGGLSAVAWSWWREGEIDWVLVGLALATSVAAQVGDLVESLIKRGAEVKDSGTLLPGHGGFLDRIDALLFAAPFWWLVLEIGGRLPSAP